MVVNYDLPTTQSGQADPSTYVHRIGRTGRFGRKGVAISFVHDKKSYNVLSSIQHYFGDVDMTRIPTDDWDQVEKMVKKVLKEWNLLLNNPLCHYKTSLRLHNAPCRFAVPCISAMSFQFFKRNFSLNNIRRWRCWLTKGGFMTIKGVEE